MAELDQTPLCGHAWMDGACREPPFHREQDRWKTAERPWNLLDLSMVFQWTFNDLRGLSRFLADLSVVFVVSVVSKTFWNGSKQSFSGLSGKWSFSSLSAISQWTFKGLISLSMIFRQSLLSRSFRILAAVSVSLSEFSRGSWLVFQSSFSGLGQSFRDLDWSFKDLWQYARWSFSDLSIVLLVSQ